MKSVLQAGWLFTVAVGNFIVLIIAEGAQLPDQVGGLQYIQYSITFFGHVIGYWILIGLKKTCCGLTTFSFFSPHTFVLQRHSDCL